MESPSLSMIFYPMLTGLSVGIVNKGFNALLRSEIARLFFQHREDLPFFPNVDGSYWRQLSWTQINPPPEELMLREKPFIQQIMKDAFTVRTWQTVFVTVTAVALSILFVPKAAKSSRDAQVIYTFFTAYASIFAILCTTDLSLSKLENPIV